MMRMMETMPVRWGVSCISFWQALLRVGSSHLHADGGWQGSDAHQVQSVYEGADDGGSGLSVGLMRDRPAMWDLLQGSAHEQQQMAPYADLGCMKLTGTVAPCASWDETFLLCMAVAGHSLCRSAGGWPL